jgi:DNA adenine methylase
MEIHKKRCKVKAEQALYQVAKLMLWCTSDEVYELIDMMDVEPTTEMFYEIQSKKYTKDIDLAFQAIFLNRTAFSGILSAGPMGGRHQDGKYKINSKYNFKVLRERILACHLLLEGRTIVTCKDFRDVLAAYGPHTPMYLDPPYFLKGTNELYSESMSYEDHCELAAMLKYRDNWIMSYDDCDLIRSLYPPEYVSKRLVSYPRKNNGDKTYELNIRKWQSGVTILN